MTNRSCLYTLLRVVPEYFKPNINVNHFHHNNRGDYVTGTGMKMSAVAELNTITNVSAATRWVCVCECESGRQ